MYVTRGEASFVGLTFSPRAFVEQSALAVAPPGDLFLYGSFLRSAWTREAWGDVNVAFRTEEARAAVAARRDPSLRLSVADRLYTAADELLDDADFTVCQVVYHDGRIHHSPLYFEHLAQRLLALNTLHPDRAAQTLLRVFKYVKRGYALSAADLSRILRRVDTKALGSLDPRLLHHAAGVLL